MSERAMMSDGRPRLRPDLYRADQTWLERTAHDEARRILDVAEPGGWDGWDQAFRDGHIGYQTPDHVGALAKSLAGLLAAPDAAEYLAERAAEEADGSAIVHECSADDPGAHLAGVAR